ncbi:hypothetical protein FRC07_005811 [Ceratobasidium sp. 392]|nr:hypothetical protein FRC07_005811 [Ceratobasidium sp. 392]
MPETALENNPNGFVYGLWGERTMGTFEASGRAGPLTRPGTTMATSVLHSNAIAGSSMPQGTMSNYDNRDVEMPRTPLKHDRGEFDYGLWSEASAGVTDETRLISMDHHEPIGAQTPRTPINRNRGTVFDYEMWARRLGLVSSVDETNHQERAASPGPVMDMPRLRSNVPARASIRSLHVLRRRIGARNLRAAAAAHKEMGEDGGMGPTTSMLNNVLVAQREGGISRDSMGHTEIARRWIALPPLVGYYERSRKYRERNGESDTSRTGSDSASLLTPGATPFLTPGTTSLLTPRTSACPTMTEEYYSEIAVKWEALQKERWQIGLQEAYEGYTGDMAAELGRSMVAKAVEVVGRTFRGLWKN